MSENQEPRSLQELLDRVESAAQDGDRVTFRTTMAVVGRRSFGTLLLLAGLIIVAPVIGDIPGVPTIIGVVVFLIAAQLLLGREQFWLPGWLLDRGADRAKLCKALGWLRRPARFIDGLLRPRLTVLTNGVATYAIALVCLLVAFALPVMEVIPFSANLAGGTLTAFGLALITRDGTLSLIAFVLILASVALIVYNLV